jgi:hypothetical protein
MLTCEVCGKNESVGVASVPGVPYSAAYCRSCLEADAHPYGIVVANTASLGGIEEAAPWWVALVKSTIAFHGKTMEQFNADVEDAIMEDFQP